MAAQIAQCERCVYFEVSDETMKKRLLKRGETSGRSDDNEETIAKRVATFHEVSEPVIDYYRQKDKLLAVRHFPFFSANWPLISRDFLQMYSISASFFLLWTTWHHLIIRNEATK